MDYIDTRVLPRIEWYDRRAVWCKRVHLAIQGLILTGSIGLVATLNEPAIPRWVLAILASAIAIATGMERLGDFAQRWRAYRNTYEQLQTEIELFRREAGPYRDIANADALLVERVEHTLGNERYRWLEISGRKDTPNRTGLDL